jgi:hypothetical protein
MTDRRIDRGARRASSQAPIPAGFRAPRTARIAESNAVR